MTNRSAVYVTGLGAVTPLGHSWPETWRGLIDGRSGVDEITLFDAGDLPVDIAAEVKDWDPASLGRRDVRHLDRSVQFALAAAREAVLQAGLTTPFDHPDRVAIVVASATGGMWTMHQQMQILQRDGYRRLSAHFLPNMLVDSAGAHLTMEFGARGPSMAVVTACATGSNTIAEAAELIHRGLADVVLAGGAEACVVPLFMAGFCQMRGLASPDADGPAAAARPFDARRNGLVVGEGAAVLVLESAQHAESRGAWPLAEFVGSGLTSDAYRIAQPHPEARGMADAIRLALDESHLTPADVDYVSAHGTATVLNDRLETLALKQVLGDQALRIPVSSIKGAIGHTMGAAGAIEAAVCVQALQSGIVPPTINYDHPDPTCDLDYVPNQAREIPVRVALSNSFGMGGHNATLAFQLP